MRLMQRLAVSGLLSVILIVLLTGTFVTRRDLANAVERGVAPEERNEQQVNPAWVQSNVVPGQDEPKPEDKDRRVDFKHRQAEPSAVGPPPVPVPGPYVIKPPNPPLDDVTNQRREKIKEMMKHGWDNYVRYAWGKNELRPISKRGHSASIFGASNMGATIVDGLDTLYIMGLHDEFKQGRDWIAENLDFDILMVFKTREFMLKYVSFVLMSLGSFVRYNISWYQLSTVKKFMDKVRRDMEMEQGETLQIMKKHAYMARVYGLRFGSVFYVSLVIGIFYYASIIVYERIVPTNETRLKKCPISTDYLILDGNHLLPFLHTGFSIIILVTVFVGTETFAILGLKHAASLSEVASYYVRKTIFTNSKYQCDDKTRKDIAKAVIAHVRGLEYIKEIQENNALAYGVLLLFAITSLAINLFRLSASQSDLLSSEFEEPVASFLLILCELVYMYYLNYLCEQAYDCYNNFSLEIFHDNWYETTVATQKLLLNMMLRTSKTFSFNIFNCYTGTVEGFSVLVKTSVSYFMMISSMQQ